MARAAAHDEIADWYEDEFLAGTAPAGADVFGIECALRKLLRTGRGVCLEISCDTGVRAAQIRSLGWTPVGVDLSAGMLRHAGNLWRSKMGFLL